MLVLHGREHLGQEGPQPAVAGLREPGQRFQVEAAPSQLPLVDGGEVNRFSWVAFSVNRANKRFLITHKSRGSIVDFR